MARRIYKRDRKGRFARVAGGAKAGAKYGRKMKAKRSPSALKRNIRKAASAEGKRRRAEARKTKAAKKPQRIQQKNNRIAQANGVNTPQPDRKLTRAEKRELYYGKKGSKKSELTKQQRTNHAVRNAAVAYTAYNVAVAAAIIGPGLLDAAGTKARQSNNLRNMRNANANSRGLRAPLKPIRPNRRGVYRITTL